MKKIKYLSIIIAAFFFCCFSSLKAQQWNPAYAIGTTTGNYVFNYSQTPDQLVIIHPAVTGGSAYYQWQQSSIADENSFTDISGATAASYSFSGPLTQTMYYRQKVSDGLGNVMYSNVFRIDVASVNWENLNYVRVHNVLVPNQTDWKVIDQLPIGQKLQTTTYLDGLGRAVQKVSRETATPQNGGSLWGDVVQFAAYDAYGRQPKQYLPYTTTTQSGKYKTAAATDQPAYYSSVYNETSAYSNATYDNSPLNRVTNIKAPGTAWAAAAGNSQDYELNDIDDNVQVFAIGYSAGAYPNNNGVYASNTLFKRRSIDETGKKVIEYINKSGQLILKKVQIDDDALEYNTYQWIGLDVIPPQPPVRNIDRDAHQGWICTYSIYDDFGRLRFQIQPEAVKYLMSNNWSFSGTNGQQVLNELCFRYEYDEKGRNIVKKAPGAKELYMVYDNRDRIVFMQDGNQRFKYNDIIQEWTTNIYDELDRLNMSLLYKTSKSRSALQADIDAATTNTVTINNAGENIINLILDQRVGTGNYKAQQSIELVSDAGGDFESLNGDEFTAEIDGSATQPSTTVTTVTYQNPISNADLTNPAVCTILKYLFYDNYNFPNAQSFNTAFGNATTYSYAETIAATARTSSFPTGDKVRVLGTNTFLTTTRYYDEEGRPIQSIEENIKQGSDITTMQYHWDGRLLSSHTRHSTANSGYQGFEILTQHYFDVIGRVTSIQKKYGSNSPVTIAAYDYDDAGRLKTKHLAQGYNNPTTGKNELESLNYSYNIHNNITGINKDYALKNNTNYNKWGSYFGLYLGFDNRDNVFNKANLNGQVTGLLWNTQGDDAQRKYEYDYDNAGRLVNAAFAEKQNTTDTWNTNKADFTVTGNSGKITYDLNGNLLNMVQKTVLAGQGIVQMDNLTYTYAAYSNKLMKVTDNGNAGNANGSFGDFKDGTNTGDDYVYDDNGNLVVDLNKNVKDLGNVAGNGITYNYLDKPEQIRVAGKGTIKIVYDADGNKIQRSFTSETTGTTKITTYINQFVYEGNEVSYLNFEEGRIRVIKPYSQSVTDSNGNILDGSAISGNITLPAPGTAGTFDYFIRDYQQNVRMILTEETHTSIGTATMETSRSNVEDPIFGQTGGNNEVNASRADKPSGWSSNTSSKVSKLSKATGNTVGPNSLLKVMAGDEITANVKYYYEGSTTNNNSSLTTNLLASLLQALNGNSALANGGLHGNATNIVSNLNSPVAPVADPHQYNNDNIRRAYLSILFFDERFNFVPENSSAQRVGINPGDGSLTLPNIKAPKNGYVYVYVSNESDEPVYFDDFKVAFTRGRLIEENHYYAYGLKIAAISSSKMGDALEGSLKNNYQYNDKELWDDGDLNWLDYGFRNYDAQIGRFVQIDPLTSYYPDLSTYQYAANDPITNIDEDGLSSVPSVVPSLVDKSVGFAGHAAKNLEEVVVKAVRHVAKPTIWSIAGSFVKGFGKSLVGTVTGVVHMVAHPIQTVKALVQIVKHPVQTAKILYSVAKSTYREFKNGDGNKRSEMLGHAVGDIAQLLIGTGEAKTATEAAEVIDVVKVAEEAEIIAGGASKAEGGLNLFKFKSPQATTATGWKVGDRFLHLPNKFNPKLNWKQNSGALRREMREGKPIYDSYKNADGSLIEAREWSNEYEKMTGEFLNAERNLLKSRGWQYDAKTGAWMPPK
ncbi:MAG: RHS repeat-associated core domain-containing protein [Bacteroidetes bacterium]|nr:RHS repeat-associated core domain-containing protein [Bacteroidota bacterium]